MSDMIEPIARAIFESTFEDGAEGRKMYDQSPFLVDTELARKYAKAALTALLDPTPEIVEAGARAGCAAFHYAAPRSPGGAAKWERERTVRMKEAPAIFTAMIKAIQEGE